MQNTWWLRYVSIILVFTPVLSLSAQVKAVPLILAQADSAYDQYMDLGYTAARQRQYSRALRYFQQALWERPGDWYANIAVNNVRSYVNSGSWFSSPFGRPNRRSSAGSRNNSCLQTEQDAVALIPKKGTQLTTSGYPTFYFYVPPNSAQGFEFSLQDSSSDEPLYKKNFPAVTQSEGIVSVSIPHHAMPALATNKIYSWSLSIICDADHRDQDLLIEGSIQRLQPNPHFSMELFKATLRDRARLYATAGFWQDTIATLAELRRYHPEDLAVQKDWENLLKSIDLTEIAAVPLVPNTTPYSKR